MIAVDLARGGWKLEKHAVMIHHAQPCAIRDSGLITARTVLPVFHPKTKEFPDENEQVVQAEDRSPQPTTSLRRIQWPNHRFYQGIF